MSRVGDVLDEAQALLDLGEGQPLPRSPAPFPMCGFAWSDDVIAAVGHRFDPSHVCKLTAHPDGVPHACSQCDAVYVSTPLPQAERLADLRARAQALAANAKAESRRITERLLATEEVALPPTVEATVTRDPASEAIATATRRMVHRIGQTIDFEAERVWRRELPDLENRIATRLELVGLSPSTVRRLTDVIVTDVQQMAVLASEAIEENTCQVASADVARNLLPRINKVMKEIRNG